MKVQRPHARRSLRGGEGVRVDGTLEWLKPDGSERAWTAGRLCSQGVKSGSKSVKADRGQGAY